MINLKSFFAILKCEYTSGATRLELVPALTAVDEADKIKHNNPSIVRCYVETVVSVNHPRTAEILTGCCAPYACNVQEALEQLEDSRLYAEDEEFFLALFDSEGGIDEACDAYQSYFVRFWKGYELDELATELYRERNGVYITAADDPTEFYDFVDSLQADEGFCETEYGVLKVHH